MAKSIEVPVDDVAYAALVEEAERAGVSVSELASKLIEGDIARRRFVPAVGAFIAAWGPAFDEAFGPASTDRAAA